MIETLINIDIYLFHLINSTLTLSFIDKIMPVITSVKYWYITYLIFALWLLFKGGKNGRIALITLTITIILSDQINSAFLKELFSRIRPCHTLHNVHLLVNCPISKSFPSSHAVNNFAAATILSFFYKQYKKIFLFIAILISYSRIYVGVHYPSDVIAGALVGILIGALILLIVKQFYHLSDIESSRQS